MSEVWHLGFTGTRQNPKPKQIDAMRSYLKLLLAIYSNVGVMGHSGDCIGADDWFHQFLIERGIPITGHPPLKDDWRAFNGYTQEEPPASYFERNRRIVDVSNRILAVSYYQTPQTTGGTWYTINYALRQGKPVDVIWPDGTITKDFKL